MKTRAILLLPAFIISLLFAACADEPIPRRSGILDWSAYDTWLTEAPQIVQITPLDQATAQLLAKGTQLAEQILTEPTAKPGPDYRAAVANLRKKAPTPASASYYDPDSRDPRDRRRYTTDRRSTTITTQQILIDSYSRRWSGITESNLDSVVTQLARQVERDTEQYRINSGTTGRGSTQNTVNLQYVQAWSRLLTEARALLRQIETPAPPTDRQQALAAWEKFQETDLPILLRVLKQNEIARHPVAENGAYEIEGGGILLLHFTAGTTELYYPMEARDHRFRVFTAGGMK